MAKKSSKTAGGQPKPDDLTFEQATEELEAIIEQIESGEIGLEESLANRKRGEALIKRCRAILDKAEQEIEQVSAGDSGQTSGRSSTRKGRS